MKTSKQPIAFLIAALAMACTTPMAAAPLYTDGHADLRVTYSGGALSLFYRLGDESTVGGSTLSADTNFAASAITTFIPGPSLPRPAGAGWDFTGNASGEPLWFIGQTQNPLKPWLGFSTESVAPADFSGIKYQLTAFSGPGQLSLTSTGSFGQTTVYWQTSDGLSDADVVTLNPNVHSHYNWFLTAPGLYTFDITAVGMRTAAAGGGAVADVQTFTIQVVPEPATAGLMAAGTCLLAWRRRFPRFQTP